MDFDMDYAAILAQSNNKAELLLAIDTCNEAFRLGAPLVTDAEYDVGFNRALAKWPNAAVLQRKGTVPAKQKVDLGVYLGSLDKIYPETQELERWAAAAATEYGNEFALFLKLDGVAGLARWERGSLVTLATQGDDGRHGRDLLTFAEYLNMPATITGDIDTLSVRGEFIIPLSKQPKLAEMEPDFAGDMRSSVAGLLNRQSCSKALSLIQFVGHELVAEGSELDYFEQLNICSTLTAPLPDFGSELSETFTAVELRQVLSQAFQVRNDFDYICDGIVVRAMARQETYSLTAGNPAYACAYKEKIPGVETTIRAVNYTVGKTGKISGTVEVDPVFVGGITATTATLKSAHFIMTGYNDPPTPIGPGAVVLIERSGSVIPNVQAVLTGAADYVKPPFAYKLNKKNWYALDHTFAQKTNELLSWLSQSECELGEAFAQAATQCGYTVGDLGLQNTKVGNVKLPPLDYAALRKAGVTLLEPTLQSRIARFRSDVKKLPLPKLMAAHGPFVSIGETRATELLTRWPDLLTLPHLPDFLRDNNLSEDTFTLACTKMGLGSVAPTFLSAWPGFISILFDFDYSAEATTVLKSGGRQVCFSGFRDDRLAQQWEAGGGVYADRLVKTTWAVVCSPDMMHGTKATKMRKYGGKVLSVTEFVNLME